MGSSAQNTALMAALMQGAAGYGRGRDAAQQRALASAQAAAAERARRQEFAARLLLQIQAPEQAAALAPSLAQMGLDLGPASSMLPQQVPAQAAAELPPDLMRAIAMGPQPPGAQPAPPQFAMVDPDVQAAPQELAQAQARMPAAGVAPPEQPLARALWMSRQRGIAEQERKAALAERGAAVSERGAAVAERGATVAERRQTMEEGWKTYLKRRGFPFRPSRGGGGARVPGMLSAARLLRKTGLQEGDAAKVSRANEIIERLAGMPPRSKQREAEAAKIERELLDRVQVESDARLRKVVSTMTDDDKQRIRGYDKIIADTRRAIDQLPGQRMRRADKIRRAVELEDQLKEATGMRGALIESVAERAAAGLGAAGVAGLPDGVASSVRTLNAALERLESLPRDPTEEEIAQAVERLNGVLRTLGADAYGGLVELSTGTADVNNLRTAIEYSIAVLEGGEPG